ncbi:MAG TPA: fumarylacetoacetate hydrolase family protein [Myxococcales bacterium]|nr:fumarylacetoacetate hydrolase family protein [Myxococcales bacterium]
MATRRDVLKSAGIAALAIGSRSAAAEAAAQPQSQSLRGLTYCNLRGAGLGVKKGDKILDVAAAGKKMRVAVPASTDDVIAGKNVAGLQKVLSAKGPLIAEADAQFAPCVIAPQKIIMLGYNYLRHVKEVGVPVPKLPVMFNKYNNALNGHGGKIALPTKMAKKFDYEVELQIIMGKPARDVSEADALNYVFGYATGNDFSARDLQFRDGKAGSQFMIGKTSDGFMPVGPYLAGAEVVGDPQKLAVETRVNGEKRQSSNTADMIFSCAKIIEYASSIFTLMPGDLISTGTPEGVIAGKPEAEQVWLKAGDKVSCSVEKCGELSFELT